MKTPIQQDIEKWIQVYKNPSSKMEEGICQVLVMFNDFTSEYTDFIEQKNSGLKPSDQFPSDYLQDSIEAVLAEYWEPIKRVAQQCQSETFLLQHFPRADGLKKHLLESGYEELEKIRKGVSLNNFQFPENMLIYFDKVDKAIRYPFGPVLLIGVPYQDAKRGDWSAMPHEIGHHLFWNLQFNLDNNPAAIPFATNPAIFPDQEDGAPGNDNTMRTLRQWSEEIFADTVGALIGQRGFLENAFKKVLARIETAEDLYIHDNEHPAPYFVPYIRGFALDESVTEEIWKREAGDRFKNIRDIKYPTTAQEGGDVVFETADTEDVKKELRKRVSYIRALFQPPHDQTAEGVLPTQSVSSLTEEISIQDGKISIEKLNMWIENQVKPESSDDNPDKKTIRALLIPRILEGDKWKCRYCGKTNENDRAAVCRFCGRKR